MKRPISIILLLTIVTASFAKGFPEKEKRDVPLFKEVKLSISSDVILVQGNKQEVILEGDPNLLRNIETEVSGDKLTIKHKDWNFKMGNNKIKVYLTMVNVNGFAISGSGSVRAEKTINTDDIYFHISGSGNIDFADLNAINVEAKISGSGDIHIEGKNTSENTSIGISGSGKYNGEYAKTKNASIHVSGSGDCRITVSENLKAKVSGSGDIIYFGRPIVDISVSGSGKVKNGGMLGME